MPVTSSYDYAIIRVVPSVERGECINVGIILFCRTQRFLGADICLDEARLRALAPQLDISEVQHHLDTLLLVSRGEPGGGPIAQLSQSERFHWLVSPRSTIIQVSPVHSGLCSEPEAALRHLLDTMVCTTTKER